MSIYFLNTNLMPSLFKSWTTNSTPFYWICVPCSAYLIIQNLIVDKGTNRQYIPKHTRKSCQYVLLCFARILIGLKQILLILKLLEFIVIDYKMFPRTIIIGSAFKWPTLYNYHRPDNYQLWSIYSFAYFVNWLKVPKQFGDTFNLWSEIETSISGLCMHSFKNIFNWNTLRLGNSNITRLLFTIMYSELTCHWFSSEVYIVPTRSR